MSQRVEWLANRSERRDCVDQRLMEFLLAIGALPCPVPNVLCADSPEALRAWWHRVRPEAVVLSGGNDIGACPDRDATERTLLDLAEQQRVPVVGICRGMQMMCVRAGAALGEVSGHVRTRHVTVGRITRTVNSFHQWAVASCPDGFDVLARTDDGCLEAVGHRELPWEGWMWHPEREMPFAPDDLRRARALLGGT